MPILTYVSASCLISRNVSLRGGCGGIGEGRGGRHFTVEDSGGDLTLRTGYLNGV